MKRTYPKTTKSIGAKERSRGNTWCQVLAATWAEKVDKDPLRGAEGWCFWNWELSKRRGALQGKPWHEGREGRWLWPRRAHCPMGLRLLVTWLPWSCLGRDLLTYAALAIGSPLVAGPADADVHADEVLALHLLLSTVVFALFTLILIWKERATMNYKRSCTNFLPLKQRWCQAINFPVHLFQC